MEQNTLHHGCASPGRAGALERMRGDDATNRRETRKIRQHFCVFRAILAAGKEDKEMLATARRERVIQELLLNGDVEVSNVSQQLGVSESTIRRDLDILERQGALRRTHGGALILDRLNTVELSMRQKATLNIDEKRRIGLAAAAMVDDGVSIAMTGGTTTLQVARSLRNLTGVTIVTNAVNLALELAERPGITVVCTGGRLRPTTLELVGPLAEQGLREFNVDLAFVGVNGFSLEAGMTTHDETEAMISRLIIRAARKVVVVADHTKLGRATFCRMGTLDQVNVLITDSAADDGMLRALQQTGIEVVVT